MKENLLGIDVGGTKCAIIYGIKENDELHIIDKKKFDTTTVDETIDRILCETEKMMNLHQLTPTNTKAIGICCGGPLNSETGIVMSPPNLPGWDNIPIVAMTANAFDEDRKKAFAAGMNAHVAKPIDMAVLSHTLDEIFAKQG